MVSETETPSESGTEGLTWISWFCSLPSHQYFAEVAEEFIEDDFNLTGLNFLVPFYKEALEMILDIEPQEDSLKIPDVSIVESSAELLYGLIHQRYVITRQGLQQMVEKHEEGHFGVCPRVYCNTQLVLPCGRSDLPGLDTVKLYCPNCQDTYTPPSSRFHGIDGAFFGTTFPHLLMQCYRDLAPSIIAPPSQNIDEEGMDTQPMELSPSSSLTVPEKKRTKTCELVPARLGRKAPQTSIYIPRIYGFRVSEFALSGPRMQWMRMRPHSLQALEEA
ncbi:casein kinase 2 regulatory subunit [Malassezia vespertilionis]|uniref:casein kinase 2 regulatory subunit n=1 Tax=Malassezia vespertilionis TaxID=2020962 RepID=UPI0024B16D19|nr:casein kinase 2 regulatory subunit [Malassezia vespertilionis]WFD06489.1 casein kinase 2 regulatory subunit [Malassezia vespertilionis]